MDTKPTITLAHIEEWLRALPNDTIVCWDTFEPRHSVIPAYLKRQGYAEIICSQYDKAVQPKHDDEPERTIVLYTKNLSRFLFSIAGTSMRFQPTAAQLLDHMSKPADQWIEQAPYWPADAIYNRMQDSAARPESLNWQHRTSVLARGVEMPLRFEVAKSSHKDASYVTITAVQDGEQACALRCRAGYKPYTVLTGNEHYTGASLTIEHGNTLELWTIGPDAELLAKWKATSDYTLVEVPISISI